MENKVTQEMVVSFRKKADTGTVGVCGTGQQTGGLWWSALWVCSVCEISLRHPLKRTEVRRICLRAMKRTWVNKTTDMRAMDGTRLAECFTGVCECPDWIPSNA